MAPPLVMAARRAAAPPAQAVVDAVAKEIRAVAAAPRGDAFGEHVDDGVEIGARQSAIGIGAAHQREQIVFLPFLGGAGGDDLLRQDVERRFGNDQAIEFAARASARTSAAHSSSSSRVVAKMRPLGMAPRQCPARPMRCSATAMERGEPIWQTRSTWPISMPSSSDAVATSARISPALSLRSAARRSLRERLP